MRSKNEGEAATKIASDQRGACHGAGCIHPHWEQRVAYLHDIASIHADLRLEPAGRRKGGALRVRFRIVDDQAARLWRAVTILGPQSRIFYFDGRVGGSDQPDTIVRLSGSPDHTARAG